MGIPRLTQDLWPYAEDAILCSKAPQDGRIHIQNIVIDGPSLVYHVYKKLVDLNAFNRPNQSLCTLPTYAELCQALMRFLSDIEDCGVVISQIYFDGALPVSKWKTRLERLEKSRLVLEAYRRAFPDLKLSILDDCSTPSQQVLDVLSNHFTTKVSGRIHLTEPFIVAAGLDCLATSKWASIVKVVQGEADCFCAAKAMQLNAAVLTNDSDIPLFPSLHDHGIVLLLSTVTKSFEEGSARTATLKAHCWHIRHISSKMRISKLIYLGYERAKDSNASFNIVLQRARMLSDSSESDAGFEAFEKQYSMVDTASESGLSLSSSCRMLDPRLAELVSQLNDDQFRAVVESSTNLESLRVTLPFLLEDPTRDAAWQYGKHFRRLAYTLLIEHHLLYQNKSRRHAKSKRQRDVKEYYRKGQSIASEVVSASLLEHQIIEVQAIFKECSYHSEEHSSVTNENSPTSISVMNSLLSALHVVMWQRAASSKHSFSSRLIAQMLGLEPLEYSSSSKSPENDPESTWSLIHLNANVQAVLYSLRLLRHTLEHLRSLKAVQTHPNMDNDHADTAKTKHTTLWTAVDNITNNMKHIETEPIEKLFLKPIEVRTLFQQMEKTQLIQRIKPLIQMFSHNGEIIPLQACDTKDESATVAWTAKMALGTEPPEMVGGQGNYTTISNKKRKKQKERNSSTVRPKPIELTKDTAHSNPYDVLERMT